MKIIIATNNQSKFRVVEALLRGVGLTDYDYLRPADAGIEVDVEETGSLLNRAQQKAHAAYDAFKHAADAADIYLYVGVDDGIRIEAEHKTFAASKEATDRILQSDGIAVGDAITIVRAFAFTRPDGITQGCQTRVPMVFIGNPNNVQREEGVYPLEYVLAYQGTTTPISNLDTATAEQQNRDYMAPTLRTTLDELTA